MASDLTELQVAVSDVNGRYDGLGGDLKERLGQQQASLELRQKANQGTEELKSWLTDREQSLKQAQTAPPSKPEVVRAQAEENKVKVTFLCGKDAVKASLLKSCLWDTCEIAFLLQALLSELAEHSAKVEELKSTLRKLIGENPDSPEADTWRRQLQEIGMCAGDGDREEAGLNLTEQ